MAKLWTTILQHESAPVVDLPGAPDPLPVGHIADSAKFVSHVEEWGLRPVYCDFLHDNLVYLFYGGLFFRQGIAPTRRAAMYPVGFLFGNGALRRVKHYYPFDTGALAGGFYGSGEEVHSRWRDCCVDGNGDPRVPGRLVQYLFGSNRDYLRGRASLRCIGLPDPFPWLLPFLRRVRTDRGSDQRQYRIECNSDHLIGFDDVIWVGYPDIYTKAFADMFERRHRSSSGRHGPPVVPERWSYDTYNAASSPW